LNTLHLDLGGTKKKDSSIIYEVFQGEVQVTTETPVKSSVKGREELTTDSKTVPFMFLSMEIPPQPLFKDEQDRSIIPQVPLFTLLNKYDGDTVHNLVTGERKRYIITRLPKFLLLHIKRFNKNNFFLEKNHTIVNFPIKNLDMKNYTTAQIPVKYDLVSNIIHEGQPDKGSYSVHIQNRGDEQWYEMQDLVVKKILPELIAVSEAYLQIYEQKD